MAFKTVTILGARGMLGSDLAEAARRYGFDVHGVDLPEMDITNEGQVRDVINSGEVVINCAAYTNVEKAESQSELAERVNGIAVGTLGYYAKSHRIPVLHISTDFVFDGLKQGSYAEIDTPRPLSAYGRSKWHGEQLLAQSGCMHCIVRVQWTYGRHGTHFISKILDAAQKQQSVKVVDDQVGSPTCTADVAEVLCQMLSLKAFPQGLYHLAARGYVSRYEMARTIFEMLEKKVEVMPCKTADFKTAAVRPLNSRFDCTKLEALLGRPLETWQTMLKRYLEAL